MKIGIPRLLSTPLMALVLLFSTCSEENKEPKSPTSEFYFVGKIDNKQVLIEEKGDLGFIGGRSEFGANGQACSAGYKTGLYEISDSGIRLKLQITFYNVAHSLQPCDEADINEIFLAQLTPQDYKLSFIENEITTVGIHYLDKNGIFWDSTLGEQNSQGFLTIEKSEFIGLDESGKKLQKVEGKFAGYLYQYDFETERVTDSIFISDARFVFRFISE